MSEPRPFHLDIPSGTPLHGFLDLPDPPGPHPAVVVCHGFKGFMEWGFFPPLARLLRDRGFAVVRFNFSGSGMRPGEDRVADLEAFRDDTYAREVAELDAVLSAVGGEIGGDAVTPGPVGLFGHSRGGGVALLAAAKRSAEPAVGALVTWAAIATVDRFPAEQMDDWRRDGELPILNSRTGQKLTLGPAALAEIEARRNDEDGGELDLLAAARRLRCPWLIVHGEADETVAASDAEALTEAASEGEGDASCELLRIAGAGHTFGAVHPFAGPTRELTEALNATQTWLRRHLTS